jgi:hypothetical protein
MKRKNTVVLLAVLAFVTGMNADADGYSTGFAGATRKNSVTGCGSGGCHQGGQSVTFPVTVTGPISVTAGQTVQYMLQMPTLGRPNAGVNIATRRGILTPVTSGTRLSTSPYPPGEIIHSRVLSVSGTTATILFNYTAPASPGLDTIFSTGMVLVSGGSLSWNWSPDLFVNVLPAQKILNLACLIEGRYNAVGNTMTSDTATVYLRNSASPYTIVETAKSVIGSSGSGIFRFSTAQNGVPYYIVTVHRNSVETWSATPQSFISDSLTYSFSGSASAAFGNNQIQVDNSPVRFAVYSGDVNQDGTVDATDVSTIDNDAGNFVSGYVVTDLTGDDFVDGTDFAIADNNAANFVGAITP